MIIAQFCLAVGILHPCFADDKNGVSPNTISLPSGPGSITGLGESFQPMLNTGSARYTVDLALPAGVAGHTPGLALFYESGHGYGPAGMGWKFGPGDIRRQTEKGIPRYVDGPNLKDDDQDGEIDEADEVDRLTGIEGEELMHLADGTLRARIEGAFVRYRRSADYWIADLKDGTELELGKTAQARVADATGGRIFCWLLERSTDPNGNAIEYYYTGFSDSDNQKYLQEIRYGPGAAPWTAFYFAYLNYEQRPDRRKDYRSGFLIETGRRLASIDIGIQGLQPDKCAAGDWNRDGSPDALIRRYTLEYSANHLGQSFLAKITRFGSDGTNYLPPMSFSYSLYTPPASISAAGALMTSANAPAGVMDSGLVELVDLNRDGLPDLLQTDLYGAAHRCFTNRGISLSGGLPQIEWDDGRDMASPDGLALQLHLNEDRVHLADMDGDGIADLVYNAYSGEVAYYRNRGDRSWSERKAMSLQDTAPSAPFSSKDIKTADLDFDKRIDIVRSTDTGYRIWFNLAEGRYSREVAAAGAVHQGRVIRFSDSGVYLADVNGDHLSDVARIRPTRVVYCAGMGHGRFDASAAIDIPDAVLTDGAGGQIERARLKDVNGDGLADLVVERAQTGELWYWLNKGTDAFARRHVLADMPALFGPGMVTRWADINGNGTEDLIYADAAAASRIVALDIGELIGGGAHPNLLTGIDNGLGVRTRIGYRSSTDFYLDAIRAENPWELTVPFPVPLVSEVRVTTGLDVDLVTGVDEYVRTYRYRDGFYEDREKAFRGFAQVEVAEPGDATAPARMTTHRFFTGGPDGEDNDGDGDIDEVAPEWRHREEEALKGLVRGMEVRSAGGLLFTVDSNDWRVRTLATGPAGSEMRLAYNLSAEKRVYEGTSTPETLRTTYVTDDFGNVIEEKDFGALSIDGDEAFTYTEYINGTDPWRIGFVRRQTVTDAAGRKFSETISYYDGPAFAGLPPGQIGNGNLTRQQGWVADDRYADLLRNAYDGFGNIAGTMNPNGYRRTIAYDAVLHRFPVGETIEVGGGRPDLAVTASYNAGLGVMTGSVDFNGLQTAYGCDVFGRLTAIVRPGDSADLPTLTFAYTMADPAAGLVYAYDADGALTKTAGAGPSAVQTRSREMLGQAGTFDTVQYVDGLGRKLASLEEDEAGFAVSGAVRFNAAGTVRFTFQPYSSPAVEYAPPAGGPAAESRYDAAGREILRINPPDADGLATSAATVYAPLQTTLIDENGVRKTSRQDGRGRTIELHEENGDETLITRYAHDPPGNLTRVTDPRDNRRSFEYDGLGRRVLLLDPDRGRMQYVFDDAGNLTMTVDNKAQVIAYTYDGANRMLSEDFLDGAPFTPDVAYHYDTPSADYPAAANTRGRLAWVEDLSGAAFFGYDDRGNVTWSVKRIRDHGSRFDFAFETAYDALNRVTSNTYPDGERVSYAYNRRSLLRSIAGFVNHIDYFPSGQVRTYAYANGLTTAYAYDPRRRLTRLTTGADPLQDLSYTYDGVGNITAIADHRRLPAGSPMNATQWFEYGDLYRLTRAEGPGYGAITYRYDAIGNMVFKASPPAPDPGHIDDPLVNLGAMASGGSGGASGRAVKLPGDPPGPHAITSTGSGLVFDYDDNGNMTDNAGDIYEWDFKDRLVRTTTPQTVAEYTYDYRGQRVKKTAVTAGGRSSVYYIGQGFEIRDGRPVKYVFDGDRRVARVEGGQAATGAPGWQVLGFREGWNFFSLAVEPEDPAVDTVFAAVVEKCPEVWAYDAAAGQYRGYAPSAGLSDLQALHVGKGYIARCTEPVNLLVAGETGAADIALHPDWNLSASPTDTSMPVADALASIEGRYASIWAYDTAAGTWRSHFPDRPAFLNSLDQVQPASAYWVQAIEAGVMSYQQDDRKIYFYHPDHLGSSNSITDAGGEVVENTEYYPFGSPRHRESSGFQSEYRYTGKEQDKENDLMYYEARYYEPVLGRFLSVDPLCSIAFANFQSANISEHYKYSRNNPILYVDPTGLQSSRSKSLWQRWSEAVTCDTCIDLILDHGGADTYEEVVEKRLESPVTDESASISKVKMKKGDTNSVSVEQGIGIDKGGVKNQLTLSAGVEWTTPEAEESRLFERWDIRERGVTATLVVQAEAETRLGNKPKYNPPSSAGTAEVGKVDIELESGSSSRNRVYMLWSKVKATFDFKVKPDYVVNKEVKDMLREVGEE